MSRRREPAIPADLLDQLLARSAASAAFGQGVPLYTLKMARKHPACPALLSG